MRIRIVMTSLALALASLFGTAIVAQPASAAVSCYGDYCSGRDPQATGCSAGSSTVAYTQAYFNRAGGNQQYAGLLELRWSPTCKTNWARFTTQADISYTLVAIQRETGYAQRQDAGRWQSAWTSQIYSPSKCVSAELHVKWAPGYANPTTVTTVCI